MDLDLRGGVQKDCNAFSSLPITRKSWDLLLVTGVMFDVTSSLGSSFAVYLKLLLNLITNIN